MAKRDIISVLDMKDDMPQLLELAARLKKERGTHEQPLKGKTLAMIFEKPSTRTKISFDVAMNELGGHPLYLSAADLQMGHGETVEDTARVMSRFVHGIMYRAFDNKVMCRLAELASVPVISGLDDLEHPCQALTDMLTIKEKKGGFKGRKLVYVGDGNNVCNSLLYACAVLGMDMVACCPETRKPNERIMKEAAEIASKNGCVSAYEPDPKKACKDADVLYVTRIQKERFPDPTEYSKVAGTYRVDKALLMNAKSDLIIMHPLPRVNEIATEVDETPNAKYFEQAFNGIPMRMAILCSILGGEIDG